MILQSHEAFFTIIHEDNHLIVVNKRNGVPSQGDQSGDTPLTEHVKEYLKETYNKPGNVFTGLVHRIDRPVSGIVVLAKTSKALERMNKIFHDREVKKTYYAIVKNKPENPEGKLIHWLIKDGSRNVTKAHKKEVPNGLRSELDYKLIASLENYYLLEINPITGRSHQIRSQLAAIGSPIKGDVKYGFDRTNKDGSICLHARKISFLHPVSKEPVEFTADMPDSDIWGKFEL